MLPDKAKLTARIMIHCVCVFLLFHTSCSKPATYPQRDELFPTGRIYVINDNAYVMAGPISQMNNGNSRELIIQKNFLSKKELPFWGSRDDAEVFLKFDLNEVTPWILERLHKAHVRLRISETAPVKYDVAWELEHVRDDSWNKCDITWINKPKSDYRIDVLPMQKDGYVYFDVTNAVRHELKKDKVLSMRLRITLQRPDSGSMATFYSNGRGIARHFDVPPDYWPVIIFTPS